MRRSSCRLLCSHDALHWIWIQFVYGERTAQYHSCEHDLENQTFSMLGYAKLGYLMLGRYLMQSVQANKKGKDQKPRPTYQVMLTGVLY